jgi:hypothetical protein
LLAAINFRSPLRDFLYDRLRASRRPQGDRAKFKIFARRKMPHFQGVLRDIRTSWELAARRLDKMDENELASVQKLFADIFCAAASDLPGLVEVAQKVVDDTFDMRPVLQLAEDKSNHKDSRQFTSALRSDYDRVVDFLSQSAGRISDLITQFDAARYSDRLQEARAAIGDTLPPRPIS